MSSYWHTTKISPTMERLLFYWNRLTDEEREQFKAHLGDGPWIHHPTTIRVEDMELSVRLSNRLPLLGIRVLADFAEFTPRELLAFDGIGKRTLREIEEYLADFGLRLLGDDE